MRAIQITAPGGPEAMSLVTLPSPEAGPGQLLVQTIYAGVNFIDIYRRQGIYPVEYPSVPGSEGCGIVLHAGEGVSEFSPGQRVAWAESVTGSYATEVVIDAGQAIAVPEGVSDEQAAALPLQGMTAHYLVCSAFIVHGGHEMLLHAGAGGVGLLATQLAVRAGARVITTVGAQWKEHLSREAGADVVIRYDQLADLTRDLPRAVRDVTDGAGVHVVYDGVGAATFDASLACLRRRGLLVLFGGASGQVPPLDLQRLNRAGSLYVTRPTLGDYTASRSELMWRADDLFSATASGDLRVTIAGHYGLDEAARAHAALAARETAGKVLLAA